MQKKEKSNNQNHGFSKEITTNEHRIRERREKDCPGFTYVTTVGWICRRENVRRKNDNFLSRKSC